MIEARGLAKKYGNVAAVQDLSFDVLPGHVTGFLGPNGAGKSTTMRLMLGLDRGAGRTTFGGKEYAQLDHPLRHVGVVLEAKAFHPTRRAKHHLGMLAAAAGVSKQRVNEVLALVGLDGVANRRPKGFSLGMGQRLGLAAALLGDPHTLMLDEPANGLDPQGILWLRDMLKGFAATGRTVFVSSHLLAEMEQLADHIIVIGKGQLLADTSIAEFVARAPNSGVVVRTPDASMWAEGLARFGVVYRVEPDGAFVITGMSLPQVGDLAHSGGIRLHELSQRTATLEEAFLQATHASVEYRGAPQAPPPPVALQPPPSLAPPSPPVHAPQPQEVRP